MRPGNRISRADHAAREDLQHLPERDGEDREAEETARVGRIGREATRKDRGDDEVDRLDRDLLEGEAYCRGRCGSLIQPVDQALRTGDAAIQAAAEEYACRP